MTKKVAVIGAGIVGITTAYYLAKKGYKVTVYEQEYYPAMRTSFANGGQISVSNSEVWTTTGNIKKGFKWMFQKDAPLFLNFKHFSWAKVKWLCKFLWHTWKGDYHKNTLETIRMGLESRKLYKQIIEDEGIEFDQTDSGILHFYKNPEYFEKAKDSKKVYDEGGCEWEILDVAETMKKDPSLEFMKGIVGGTWTPSDWTGDIHKFCYELSKVLRNKYHVNFKYNNKVNQIMNLFTHYSHVVIAAGVGSVNLARQLDDNLDIYPVKGYSVTINNVNPKFLPKVSLLDDEAKIVTSSLGKRFRVAGTAELSGENYDIRRDRIEPLLKWIHTNFPLINTREYTSWACLRPMTPNMMPITRQSEKYRNIYYNTGHGHLGWTLAPYTAKQIADKI